MPRRSKASRRAAFYEENIVLRTEEQMEKALRDDVDEDSLNYPSDAIIACSEILNEFGKCPLGILHRALQMTSLYDRCCLGATNSKMRDAIVSMDIGIPVTPNLIKVNPAQLLTPILKHFLSLLLQFHLPAACPHARIFYHFDSSGISFSCQTCGGSIKFKLAAIKALSQVAYCTAIGNENLLRHRCLKFIKETEKLAVIGRNCRLDVEHGYTCEVILKKEKRIDSNSPPSKIAGNDAASRVGSRCTCTRSPDPSGDESISGARLGRRKGRRGVKQSRMMRDVYGGSCPACQMRAMG